LPHIKRVKLLISVERQREREKERWEGGQTFKSMPGVIAERRQTQINTLCCAIDITIN